MDSQRRSSTTILSYLVIVYISDYRLDILLPVTMVHRPALATTETNFKVCTSAECLSRACQNDNFHALVDIEHGEELLEVHDHLRSERIMFSRTIQRYDDDGGGLPMCPEGSERQQHDRWFQHFRKKMEARWGWDQRSWWMLGSI
jgi:hypothetical protein